MNAPVLKDLLEQDFTEGRRMRDVVWTATVDDNTWRVDVVRKEAYKADLEVYRVEGDELVHTEEVGLAYQAIFGPDMDDVAQWQTRAIEVIDAQ